MTIEQMLEGTTPIDTPKHDFKNFDQARKWAKENIVGVYRNENTGEDISLSKAAIDKYLSASAVLKSIDKDAHLSALRQIPRLIETSVLRETQQDRDNNRDIREIQRLYGAIRYDGRLHPVKITVKAYPTGVNKAYSYEVMKIENPIGQWEHSCESSPRSGYSENRRHFDAISIPTHNPNLPLITETHPTAESRRLVAEKQATDNSGGKDTNNS
ncbi:MAG: hypothetical protein LBF67_07385 [Prevotellaceae bacterium]|jgi:hypothetical protein|nr:hypothetical protein [Prevotellaceae bacterium]